MHILDVEALLADLDSPEAPVLDGSFIVTGGAGDILGDLFESLVLPN